VTTIPQNSQCTAANVGMATVDGWNLDNGSIRVCGNSCTSFRQLVTAEGAQALASGQPVPDVPLDITNVCTGTSGSTGGADASGGVGDATQSSGDSSLGMLSCPGDIATLPYVNTTITPIAPPAFTGGTILDGEYVMTSATTYDPNGLCTADGGPTSCSGQVRGSLSFSSGTFRLDVQGLTGQPICGVTPYTINGNQISAGTQPLKYTVTPDGLTLTAPIGGSTSSTVTADGSTGPTAMTTQVGAFTHQ
jgi:hypothetical protein